MNDVATAAIREYADALGNYCRCGQAVPAYHASTRKRVVKTNQEPEAATLPITGCPIRGTSGVSVNVVDAPGGRPERSSLISVLDAAVYCSDSDPRDRTDVPCAPERISLYEAFTDVRCTLFQDGPLVERLADGIGYKTYEPSQLRERVINNHSSGLDVVTLADLFRKAVKATGNADAAAATFGAWSSLADHVVAALNELELREYHQYSAYVYLNGPLCDFTGFFSLLAGTSSASAASIQIAPASDEDISRMIEGFDSSARVPLGLNNCNAMLCIPLRVPVLGTVAQFEGLYPLAADLAARAVDVLRIVHGDDIGIVGMTVTSENFGAPILRQTYHTQYNAVYASYQPHRIAYAFVPSRPISEAELIQCQGLLSHHLVDTEVKGFAIALRRFRDTWERHWPDDPERLLDIAIALEAIFLNDGNDKELRYRLALRAARFLEAPGPQRVDTFVAVRQLYDLRSQVAHGATPDTGSASGRRKLADTMLEAPRLLRRALQKLIEGHGPTGLDDDGLAAFWRHIELS